MTTGATIEGVPELSPTLQAAVAGSGNYACGLSNGMTINFASATYEEDSDWITLMPLTTNPDSPSGVQATVFSAFPDGIDVQLADVVWTATNPTTQIAAT